MTEELRPNNLLQDIMKRSRLPWYWTTAIITVVLLVFLVVVAFLEGVFSHQHNWQFWRVGLQAPVIIFYILALYPIMWRLGVKSVHALLSLLPLDESESNQMAMDISTPKRCWEWTAAFFGAIFWLLLSQPWIWVDQWIDSYTVITSMLMFSLLGWLIYSSAVTSRRLGRLSRQQLKLDIFNIEPLIPVARSSLFSSLAFIGGISLSMVFQTVESLLQWNTIVIYAVLISATLLIFFLSMWSTHSMMANVKGYELTLARKYLGAASRELKDRLEQGHLGDTKDLSFAIAAWVSYEKRVQEAPSWPFNASIIRRLLASIIVPAIVYLIKILSGLGLRF